eukprot:404314_1
MIYKWSVKINHGGSGVFVMGLSSNFHDVNAVNRAFYSAPFNYGFNIYNGRKVTNDKFANYGSKCGTNDIVTMEVDFNDGIIIFYINGKSQGTAFENIKRNKLIHYKFAVTLQDPNDGCTLTKFEQN